MRLHGANDLRVDEYELPEIKEDESGVKRRSKRNFLADPSLDALYEELCKNSEPENAEAEKQEAKEEIKETEETLENRVIDEKGVGLNQTSVSKEDAIQAAGALLVKQGCVKDAYVDAMVEREKLVTTYMSMGIAIPHGTSEAKGCVKKTGIVLVQYPQGIDFGEEMAQLIFGIAGIGDEHLVYIYVKKCYNADS